MKFNKLICIASVVMTVLSGCSGTKDIRYYSLDSADYYAKTGNINNNVLFVKGVVVPEYLDSKSFVVRGSGHEVFYTNENKWIQELSVLLNDSLLKNLRNRTEKWFVINDKSLKSNAELAVSINNFELNDKSVAVVDFDYKFNDENNNLKIGTVHHEEKMIGDGYDAMVSALNKAWQGAVDEMVLHIDG